MHVGVDIDVKVNVGLDLHQGPLKGKGGEGVREGGGHTIVQYPSWKAPFRPVIQQEDPSG